MRRKTRGSLILALSMRTRGSCTAWRDGRARLGRSPFTMVHNGRCSDLASLLLHPRHVFKHSQIECLCTADCHIAFEVWKYHDTSMNFKRAVPDVILSDAYQLSITKDFILPLCILPACGPE